MFDSQTKKVSEFVTKKADEIHLVICIFQIIEYSLKISFLTIGNTSKVQCNISICKI